MNRQTPPDTVIYAIGDIHGRLDLLTTMHERIAADSRRRAATHKRVVYLGDYVSRGADSRGVVERVQEWQPAGFELIALKGNHEDLLLRFLHGEIDAGRHWFDYDGLDTLADYGVAIADRQARDEASVRALREDFAAALPPAHLEFFRSLRVAHRAGDYCFVHGGVRPGVPLEQQVAHDCMWIRRAFLDSDLEHGALIVHGHSISAEPQVRHNRIGIDTGAYRSGVLTCLVLDGGGQSFLQT
ncbi:MAG: metallophosphoesterase family protein [Sulfuritalea sp.]|nr:metallophosphoesterase family protein [Sulfuritalea sp.]MDP1984464.1 metallophosphoesterase family protein [Sulfuritalea sp.]